MQCGINISGLKDEYQLDFLKPGFESRLHSAMCKLHQTKLIFFNLLSCDQKRQKKILKIE